MEPAQASFTKAVSSRIISSCITNGIHAFIAITAFCNCRYLFYNKPCVHLLTYIDIHKNYSLMFIFLLLFQYPLR